jgi:hypothetical protein
MNVKLIDYQNEAIQRGMLIRCNARYPYEDVVDFLICESIHEHCYQLIVATGYKAGLSFCFLPKEAETGCGISARWLIDNWPKWGYADCPVEQVWLIENTVPVEGRQAKADNPSLI